MTVPTFNYDEDGDILYVSFAPGETAMGILLNEQLLLRVNRTEHRVIGLTIMDYTMLAQVTELGPRSVPLTDLQELAPELRELALDVLQSPELRPILTLTAYTPAAGELIPAVIVWPAATSVGTV